MTRILPFILLLLFTACTNRSESAKSIGAYPAEMEMDSYEESAADMDRQQNENSNAASKPDFSLEKGSKIIKNGQMAFEVTELEKSKQKLDKFLGSFDAYYENEQFNAYGDRRSYSLVIRIPTLKFDSLIATLEKGMGQLISKNIQAQDVTEEYVDLNIRLNNNLAYLEQYKEILKKANSIQEILDVREKIRVIEEEIESKKGRLKFLDDKVKYSTLRLEITELVSREFAGQPNFGIRIWNAFKSGIQGFLDFVVVLVHFWPFLVLLVLVWFFRGRIAGVFRRKRG